MEALMEVPDKLLQISAETDELKKEQDEIIDAITQEAIKQGNDGSMIDRYFGSASRCS